MKASIPALMCSFLLLTQSVHGTSENEKFSYWNSMKDSLYGLSQNEYIRFGVKTAAVTGASVVAAPAVLAAAGFGAAGVVGGSIAAGAQSTIFGGSISGVSGAVFSTLQSLGAAGLGAGATSTLAGASAATVKVYDSAKSALLGEDKPKDEFR